MFGYQISEQFPDQCKYNILNKGFGQKKYNEINGNVDYITNS